MADEADQSQDGKKNDNSKRMTREEYDRLVQGVDDIYFGGLDEPEVEQEPPLERPADEPIKRDADAK